MALGYPVPLVRHQNVVGLTERRSSLDTPHERRAEYGRVLVRMMISRRENGPGFGQRHYRKGINQSGDDETKPTDLELFLLPSRLCPNPSVGCIASSRPFFLLENLVIVSHLCEPIIRILRIITIFDFYPVKSGGIESKDPHLVSLSSLG